MGGVTRSSAGASVPYVEVTPHPTGRGCGLSRVGCVATATPRASTRDTLAQSRRRVGAGADFPPARVSPRRRGLDSRRSRWSTRCLVGRPSAGFRPRGSHSTLRRARVASRTTAAEASRSRPSASDRATGRRRDRGAARGHRTRSRDGRRPPRPARSRPPPDPVAPPRQPRHPVPTESRPPSCRVPETEFPGSDIQDDAEDNLHRPAAEDAQRARRGPPPRARR